MRGVRYSLSSRFRGTLLGAAIGEIIAKSSGATIAQFFYPDAPKLHAQEQLLDRSEKLNESVQAAPTGRLAVLGAESLIRLGRFDLDDWGDAFSKDSLLRPFFVSSDRDLINCLSTTAIITTLPIALFYHENEIKLRQNLQLALVAVGQDDAVTQDGAFAVGYAIAQSLNEKLNAATLIPQIITFLKPQTQIAQNLAQVQTLLEQRAGLERAVTELSQVTQPSTPIALAFYCFLSTLEDLRLSVVRAALTSYQPQITTAIAAALSGAYNGASGIPINWRLALSQADTQLAASGITAAEIFQISDSLVAVWSGVYDQATQSTDLTQVAAIAAPRVIRSR